MPGVFHATEKDTEQHGRLDSVTVVLYFVVGVKVSCISVERNTFRYAYHFIHKCCVLHIYLAIAVCNGWYLPKLLSRRVHGVAQARNRKTLHVSKESSAVCS
jgi:hypothetical protein